MIRESDIVGGASFLLLSVVKKSSFIVETPEAYCFPGEQKLPPNSRARI